MSDGPPHQVRDRWRESAKRLGMQTRSVGTYVDRWTDVWRDTIEQARADGRPWSDVHLSLVEDYVEARRMAHDHQRIADAQPYVEGSGGRYYAHPGIEKAAARRAREGQRAVRHGRIGQLDRPGQSRQAASSSDRNPCRRAIRGPVG